MHKEMIDTIRAMAEVKVVQRYHSIPLEGAAIFEAAIQQRTKAHEIVAIGCSTGGPQTLQTILSRLPQGFPIPIVITQHISKGFIGGLVSWLRGNTLLEVMLAEDMQKLQPGTVYLAPDNHHLCIERGSDGLIARLKSDSPVNGFMPSVTVLFKSVAATCRNKSVGVLLTGMGADGADGLLDLRQAGAHTIVQDEASAVVYGMPGSAIALNAVDQVVPLQNMASYLLSLARK